MRNTEDKQTAKHLFTPQKFKLENLLLFWCLTVLLPLVIITLLLNYAFYESRENEKILKTSQLIDTAELLQRNCVPETYFKQLVSAAEETAGFPARQSRLQLADDIKATLLLDELNNNFAKLPGLDLLLFISAEKDLTNIQVVSGQTGNNNFIKPGKRAATAVLEKLCILLQPSDADKPVHSKITERLMGNFAESIFGEFYDPLSEDNDFSAGFVNKLGGIRIFTARRFIFDHRGRPLLSYIGVFCENRNLLVDAFKHVKEKLPTDFSYSLATLQARPFSFVSEMPNGGLRMASPVSFSPLTSGTFCGEDLISKGIKSGVLRQSPSLYPYFIISTPLSGNVQKGKFRQINFAIFLTLCLSLLFLKSFHQSTTFRFSIRKSLIIAVFLATAMPAAIFLFFAHRHALQLLEIRKIELLNLMKNNLAILELSLATRDEKHTSRYSELLPLLRQNLNQPIATLERIIAPFIDKTLFAINLQRNDGETIAKMNINNIKLAFSKKRITLHNEIIQASMIRLFMEIGLMKESFHNELLQSSIGKKLLAIASVFEKVDVDIFCGYEGQAHTSRKDFGTFRFKNYKILPEINSADTNAALLLIVQDLRDMADMIIMELAEKQQIFNIPVAEGVIETSLVGTIDLDATEIDPDRIWPKKSTLDKHAQRALQAIAHGKSEITLNILDDQQVATILTAKKIGRYPLVAISQCNLIEIARSAASIRIMMALFIGYFLILILILTSYLNEMFVEPIKTLAIAARLTGEGQQIRIDNNFTNELALLTAEFTVMSGQIKERERLARFISREAENTIAHESKNLQTMPSIKAKRTILFIHIRHFTELTEQLAAVELISLLNHYFVFFERHITDKGGQIDKYIADAIMAVFSDQPDTTGAAAACLATRQLLTNMSALNKDLAASGLPPIQFGAGIATGEVISGRIGSYEGRLDYTVIGDRVNLAARLEAMSHAGESSRILVDEETLRQSGQQSSFKRHGAMQVKGKIEPVEVFELGN